MAGYHNQKKRQSIRIPEYDQTQPCEMLLEELFNPKGLTQRELADAIHFPYRRVKDIVDDGQNTSTFPRIFVLPLPPVAG